MMVVNVESSEATVIEFKIGDHAIDKWLKEPGEEAEITHPSTTVRGLTINASNQD